ncbi:uncharacterized protein LOC132724383 [Ruditapes philippinarum]|uniref:uncharacterized protein LOC132724383 n=1 Tax=Ruditapes philippinarum TaxID=129788 RepID=UPI00295BFB5B|nr:uncharacterized protein LOC132724383 [Ruditapes philippinarum]
MPQKEGETKSYQVLVRDEHFYCSICLEIYDTPRTLPCLHSFCQECLKGYILKITQDSQTLLCPVCRADTKTDKVRFKSVEKWVENFPINFTLLSILKERKLAMNPKENDCEACLREDIKVEAIVYCYDCSEKLCEDCKRHHRKNKVLSNHKLIEINESKAVDLSEFEYLANLSKCSTHSTEDVKYLCKDHDQLCCNECAIVTHRKCEDMVSLIDEIKEKEECIETCLEKRLITIDSYVGKLIKHETTYLESTNKKEKEAKACLTNFKEKLDAAYSKLETRVMLGITWRKHSLSKASSLQKESAEKLKGDIKYCDEKIKKARTYGTAIHAFLLEREMGKKVIEYEETFINLRQQSSRVLPTLLEACPLQEVLGKIDGLYQIREMRKEPILPSFPQRKAFTSRKLNLEREVNLNESQPRYCLWVGNYIVVSFERTSKLVAYKTGDGSPVSTYQCPSPTSVTAIENDKFAVALPSINKIIIMQIQQNHMMYLRELTCSKPDLIAYDKKTKRLLTLSTSETVIRKITIDGKDADCIDLSRIERKYIENTHNVYVDSQLRHILISSHSMHMLLCTDMSGNVIFQHKIEYPWSVITDSQANVYVANYSENSIQLLNPNGQSMKAHILGKHKESYPLAMSFNKEMTKLVVTLDNLSGKMRIFKFE